MTTPPSHRPLSTNFSLMQRSLCRWPKSRKLGAATFAGGVGVSIYTWVSLRSSDDAASSLNPHTFTPFTLVSRDRVSDTSSLLVLRSGNAVRYGSQHGDGASQSAKEMWQRGVWSVEIKQPQLMIARRYTPLPPLLPSLTPASESNHALGPHRTPTSGAKEKQQDDIAVLIRRSPGSEIPHYLHMLPVGYPNVEVRGAYLEYVVPDDVEDIVFIAGGTGIAPALQVAHCLSSRAQHRGGEAGSMRMRVLWASRGKDDCAGAPRHTAQRSIGDWTTWLLGSMPGATDQSTVGEEKSVIVRHMEGLSAASKGSAAARASQLNFAARYFVDEERSFIHTADVTRALAELASSEESNASGRRLVLVSGPDGFVSYIAGPKRLANGVEMQGPLGGLLAAANTRGWEVWKL